MGILEEEADLTTISSLKHQRSSIDPPPLATISKSGRVISILLNPTIAFDICLAALSPCTKTGHKITFTGNLSEIRCRMSCITAPVGEVITPIT